MEANAIFAVAVIEDDINTVGPQVCSSEDCILKLFLGREDEEKAEEAPEAEAAPEAPAEEKAEGAPEAEVASEALAEETENNTEEEE